MFSFFPLHSFSQRFVVMALFVISLDARADSLPESLLAATYLINVQEGGKLSSFASRLAMGGLMLSDGRSKSFFDWYKPKWVELRFDFMTQFQNNFGILWSVSTGERAQKYTISPEFRLGVIYQFEPFPSQFLSFSTTRSLGGVLREKPCAADYGEFGVQAVNCRLAAGVMPPEETLNYLINMRPSGRQWFGIKYRIIF